MLDHDAAHSETLSEQIENAHAEELDRGDLARWAQQARDLETCLRDIRRYCGDRGDYLGWVARRIDVEGRFR